MVIDNFKAVCQNRLSVVYIVGHIIFKNICLIRLPENCFQIVSQSLFVSLLLDMLLVD